MGDVATKSLVENKTLALDVWKYYSGFGGDDKNWMVQIVTWLLGISAAIIALYATGELNEEPYARDLLLILGILISLVAVVVALLYGGYATWNWARADRIAENYLWEELYPKYDPLLKFEARRTRRKPRFLWLLLRPLLRPSTGPLWLAKPCEDGIAPIFWLFAIIAVGSGITHALLLFRTM